MGTDNRLHDGTRSRSRGGEGALIVAATTRVLVPVHSGALIFRLDSTIGRISAAFERAVDVAHGREVPEPGQPSLYAAGARNRTCSEG